MLIGMRTHVVGLLRLTRYLVLFVRQVLIKNFVKFCVMLYLNFLDLI